MNQQQLEKLGYSFIQRANDVLVTQNYCFSTGDPHWDGDVSYDCDDADYGEYANVQQAVCQVASEILIGRAIENLSNMLSRAVERANDNNYEEMRGIYTYFHEELRRLHS